jgi:PAS domain S-box-containing protein
MASSNPVIVIAPGPAGERLAEYGRSLGLEVVIAADADEARRLLSPGQAQQEIDARLRFEAVLNNAPVGIAVVSADELRFELANVRWLEIVERLGRTTSDTHVIGMLVEDVMPGFEGPLRAVAKSRATRVDDAIEVETPNGTCYLNRVISAVSEHVSSTSQTLTVLIQDVTEQVRTKKQIETLADLMAERSAQLDSVLTSMTDALWVYDETGEVQEVNGAALSLFGLGSRTEAVEHGSLVEMSLRYPDGKRIPQSDYPQARALRGEVVPDYLAIGRHLITGHDVDLSIAAAPIESNGVVGAVLVMRDISAIQELDRKKDEFLSVASHELRTPLTTIKGYAQLLEQTVDECTSAERQTYLGAVLGEIERMMGLISELLDVSRIETKRLHIHPQPVPWREFLERRAEAFRVQNPGREIRFSPRIDSEVLLVDLDRMRQVIDNLLSNAVKYSPDGSAIDVESVVEDGEMRTIVIDHGIGIPQDEIPRLFDRFHRARNVSSRYYGGLGLGLYIAHAIVEAHGGAITVESTEGSGSRFVLKLPMA